MKVTVSQPDQALEETLNLTPAAEPFWSLEIRELLRPLLKWWWVLVLIPLLSAGIAYYLTQHNTKYYQARTLLNIGPPISKIGNDSSLLITIRLGSIYRRLVEQDSFLALVKERSGLNITTEQLRQAVVVQYYTGTPFIEMQIVDSSASGSLLILKTINDALIQETPEVKELRFNLQRRFLSDRQIELAKLIDKDKLQLDELQKQLGVEGETTGKNVLIDRSVSALKSEIIGYQQELEELGKYNSDTAPNQVYVLEQPHLIAGELGPQPKNAAIALAILSFVLLVAIVFILEKLNDRISTRQQVERLLNTTILIAPQKSGKRAKIAHNTFELLATDLLAAASEQSLTHRFRLLLLYEQYTLGVPELVQGLAQALAQLNMNVKVSKRGTGQFQTSSTWQEVIEIFGVSPSTDTQIQNLTMEWELVVQNWPTGVKFLSLLSQDCHSALVMCSLNQTKKKNLLSLTGFLQTTRLRVAGVLIL